MLRLKKVEIQEQIDVEQARLRRVENRLRQIELEEQMTEQEVIRKQVEPVYVLSIRRTMPQPADVGATLAASYGAVMPLGIEPAGPPIAHFHDPEFVPENLDVEIALPVSPDHTECVPLPGGGELSPRTLPAIDGACLLHQGTFDAISTSYEALGKWIAANGLQIAGPSREVYLSAPDEQGNAMTEIQWPVRPA